MKNQYFNKTFLQLYKYGLVGVFNTLLTLAIIWILTQCLNSTEYVANIIGYVAGIVNSFIWNRNWTFNSKSKVSKAFFLFIIIFVFSYLIQLGVLYLLLKNTAIDAFICQFLSMCVYTAINFPLNRYITFK